MMNILYTIGHGIMAVLKFLVRLVLGLGVLTIKVIGFCLISFLLLFTGPQNVIIFWAVCFILVVVGGLRRIFGGKRAPATV